MVERLRLVHCLLLRQLCWHLLLLLLLLLLPLLLLRMPLLLRQTRVQ